MYKELYDIPKYETWKCITKTRGSEMVKKITIIVCSLLLLISTNVYAGDIPESIMAGEQKSLFIGEITNIDTDSYSIDISTVMMGSIEESNIKIKRFDKYYGTEDNP